jgi:hypothetical protein
MPDNSPRSARRKRSLIAPLVTVLVLAGVILAGVFIHSERQAAHKPAVAPPRAPPPVDLTPEAPAPPLTRTELVQAANAAAAAYATAAPPGPERSPMIGRRFVVRIPFGCGGPGAAGPTAQAATDLDPANASLKLTARPAVWTSLPVMQDVPHAERIETVEGFWIPRPWANSEACPPKRDTPLPATPTPVAAQTIGLARIFEKGGSRVLMRGDRPYQYSLKLPKDGAVLPGHTYRLVLEGRLVGYGDGRVTHCWSETADHRPICLFAVAYDRVAFEDADSGAVLAEWRE